MVRRQCCDGQLRERTKTPSGTRAVAVAVVPALARLASAVGGER
jgi:hypothetical protein